MKILLCHGTDTIPGEIKDHLINLHLSLMHAMMYGEFVLPLRGMQEQRRCQTLRSRNHARLLRSLPRHYMMLSHIDDDSRHRKYDLRKFRLPPGPSVLRNYRCTVRDATECWSLAALGRWTRSAVERGGLRCTRTRTTLQGFLTNLDGCMFSVSYPVTPKPLNIFIFMLADAHTITPH